MELLPQLIGIVKVVNTPYIVVAKISPDFLRNHQDWYKNYSKNYRDALAHRVPLYVPPVALNNEEAEEYLSLDRSLLDFSSIENIIEDDIFLEKQSQLGKPCYFFAHSLNENGQPMLLHAQIITDFITIEEIVEKFCLYFNDV